MLSIINYNLGGVIFFGGMFFGRGIFFWGGGDFF